MQAGDNPYEKTQVLNWPPFWMLVLRGVGLFSNLFHVSAIRVIQFVLIACECLVTTVCYVILKQFFNVIKPEKLLTPVLALNPIAIFQSCQHGNFDVFVGLWVALMVYALLRCQKEASGNWWLVACLCVGMGIFTKTVPVVLAPLLIVGAAGQRKATWLAGTILALAPVAISMSLLYLSAPDGVVRNVIGYRSIPGYYGITGIIGLIDAADAMSYYLKLAPWLILAFVGWIGFLMKHTRLTGPKTVVVPALALLVFLPTFGPGYSPTYIYWFLPLLPLYYQASAVGVRRFLVVGLVVVTCTYVYEYAVFNSHGAFLTKMITSRNFQETAENLGGRRSQVPARLPMFAFYVGLLVLLVREMMPSGKTKFT